MRKYDDGLGRFTCPDALWEKYYSWTPYQYSMNNPVNLLDGNGYYLTATDESTQNSIRDAAPKDLREFITYNDDGQINIDQINKAPDTDDIVFNAIKGAAINTEHHAVIEGTETGQFAQVSDGEIREYTFDENFAARTTFPKGQQGNDAFYSVLPGKIHVQYDPTPAGKSHVPSANSQTIMAEIVGHVLRFMNGKSFLHSEAKKDGVDVIGKEESNVMKETHENYNEK